LGYIPWFIPIGGGTGKNALQHAGTDNSGGQMKILLIDPPYNSLRRIGTSLNYPLGLASIAAFLNKHGHQALYLSMDVDPRLPAANTLSYRDMTSRDDLFIRETGSESTNPIWDNLADAVKCFRPQIVGISTISVKIRSVLKLSEIIKQIDSGISVVLGGHHSQIFAKELLDNASAVDFIVMGEGEETALELAEELGRGSKRFDSIRGLAFREGSGKVKINEARPLIKDLDILPPPEHCHYYDRGRFIPVPKISIMSSRGCPYSCHYCATNNIWRMSVRWRSPENVAAEIKGILANQKEKYLSFYDDCFTLDKAWLLKFCEIIIKEKIRINWQCITSLNLMEEEIFSHIVKAGCIKVNFAIESGSQRILESANKRIRLDNVKKIFTLAKKYKISTAAYIMLGFPGETEEDIRLTQAIIREVKPNWVYCSILMPLPGTKYYEICLKDKLLDPESAWRGETLKRTIMNFTGTIGDQRFFELVDETFYFCYKINTNWINLIKRMPVRNYLVNPLNILKDVRRTFEYIKNRQHRE